MKSVVVAVINQINGIIIGNIGNATKVRKNRIEYQNFITNINSIKVRITGRVLSHCSKLQAQATISLPSYPLSPSEKG